MTVYDLVIRGNLVLEEEVILGEIGIVNEKIKKITDKLHSLRGKETLEFTNEYIFPGMIDVHVHCYTNPDEGFETTSLSAAVGGITSFLDMPYDNPDPITDVQRFNKKVSLLEESAVVDMGLYGTIRKINGTDQIKKLAEAGAMAFKLSTFEVDEYRFPRIPDFEIIKAMEKINECGLRVVFHAENEEIIKVLTEEYEQKNQVYSLAHTETRPPVSETSAVLKLLEFAYWTDVKLHIAHVSHPRTLELIEIFKIQGVSVTAETCYNYLLLNLDDFSELGPKAKINPPLRSEADQLGLWNYLKENKVDLISSDHSPWGYETKEPGLGNIFHSTSGLPGLEIMVPLLFDEGVLKGKITTVQFAKLMSTHPAEAFQILNKGKISVGYDADFTIINPDATWVIDESKFKSSTKLSPYHGEKVTGKIVQTIVRGRVVYDGENVLVDPGYGNFIHGHAK